MIVHFRILINFKDNEVVQEVVIIWNHSFSNYSGRKFYKGKFFFFPNLFFNDNAQLKFGECEFFFRAENCKQLYCAHCLDALLNNHD